ncbi:tRNA pseudouridine(38-40) synthase TruA [Microbacterium sp. SSW1-59]|uniref:tRNA pseudouridine(38-40) synthase TruA n=1 Tax=Microbacterium xanthum TaxID=3079794 RepID=UPI002AD31CF7|nr:tRNA pseudouridine(38-40) synthase TruA [Microbacterium sp. SSW1-59]MDZ8201154.1 tRNA pseudouridine(38-40) synthase TruA [Microbacterium sp. SSW1-59]
MRIRLDIAYDGTHFRGWARQPSHRTVQGEIEGALARVLGGDPRLVVAGRTDAGVHATGQVAHVDLDDAQTERMLSRRSRGPHRDPVEALAGRLRGVLGAYADATVTTTCAAPEGFDARFSAVWRRYAYRIADDTTGYDPLERSRTTTVRAELDVDRMDEAARTLVGLHDFAAYCKPREEATTIRTLLEFDWRRDGSGVLVANVKADAFCHSMVRALVGGCVAVGEGRLRVVDLARIRDDLVRVPEVKVLAARGLTLTAVGYPAADQLAARAAQTRNRRDRD